MTRRYPREAVIVSSEAFASQDPHDLIYSNIDVVNAHFDRYFTADEISADALRSYYVDYFCAQFQNGGFSQFVYNSRWGECIDLVTDGFAAMGAQRHLALFERASLRFSTHPGIEALKNFLSSEYFGDNPIRDVLNELDDEFLALETIEDLVELNAVWLRNLPNLIVLSEAEIDEELERRQASIPDLNSRISEALALEPRYMKLIRQLCQTSGQNLDRVTAGDPSSQFQNQKVMAWHFLTDKGHHRMIELEGKAMMLKGLTDEVVCQVDVER